ncbi:uncharacterized protein [Hetaerina americana]|uniref:uncharacterized protein n=1 Tax=Hetaerina americana TaxID=62018 RepID=UPI003A7F21AA
MDWDYIDRATTANGELLLRKDSERQKKKFARLNSTKAIRTPLDRSRTVINLTDTELDEPTLSVLSKGLNFAPAPRSIPYTDFIGGIEQAVRKLPGEAAEEVRNEVTMVLKRALPPKSNTFKEEREALQALRRKTDIMVLPADKGNATVIMKKEECHSKIREVLSDTAYVRLSRDPTDAIMRKTSELLKKAEIPAEITKHLRPQAPAPPRLYGLPKNHKTGAPLRPIVSAISSPTYNLAKHLTSVLSPHVGCCENHLRNSADFVKILDEIRLEERDILVSLDVVSLFTRVPLTDTLRLLEAKFDATTVMLFRHVLTSTYFLYDGQYFEQADGVDYSGGARRFTTLRYHHVSPKKEVMVAIYNQDGSGVVEEGVRVSGVRKEENRKGVRAINGGGPK